MDNLEQMNKRLHKLEFRGKMSFFYHEKRERFYNSYLNWTAFLSIIFSSAAFLFINNQLDLFGVEKLDTWLLALSALLVSAMNGSILAFGMVHKSHEHAIFRSKWVRFLREVSVQRTNDTMDTDSITQLERQFHNLTEEEPSTIPKDVEWAYNKTIDVMGLTHPKKG